MFKESDLHSSGTRHFLPLGTKRQQKLWHVNKEWYFRTFRYPDKDKMFDVIIAESQARYMHFTLKIPIVTGPDSWEPIYLTSWKDAYA